MREIRLYGSEGGGAARSPYPYHTFRRNPPRNPPNFLLDIYRRMSILTLVYINKYPYERLGGAQSVFVVLG